MQEKSIKKSNFFERLEQIIDFYGIKNINDFAVNHLGYKSSQKINRLKEENTSPSFEILNDISNKFENINPGWLLTGKGKMINEDQANISTIHQPKLVEKMEDVQNIPLYDIKAAAGLKLLFAGGKQNIVDTLRIPNLTKVDGAMFITGDSMYPLLKSGDIVVFKQIHNIDYLHLGDRYYWQLREYEGIDITLPVFDPFWEKFFSPNDWTDNQFSVVQVRKEKYKESNSKQAVEYMEKKVDPLFQYDFKKKKFPVDHFINTLKQ